MRLEKDIKVGDRVQVKPKDELPDEDVIGVSDNRFTKETIEGHPINHGIGFITQIIDRKYERHYKVKYPIGDNIGLDIIVTDRQLDKAFDVRNCTMFKALNMCGECETRFYCYTNNRWKNEPKTDSKMQIE
jgi:hypothetical protein